MESFEREENSLLRLLPILLVLGFVIGSGVYLMKNNQVFANGILPSGGCCGNNAAASQSNNQRGCGMNPGEGCGNGRTAQRVDLPRVQVEAREYYRTNYSEATVNVKVTDYGCHIQADVYENELLVKSLGYNGPGEFYEIN